MSDQTAGRATEQQDAGVTEQATERRLILDPRLSARTAYGTPALGGLVATGLGAAAIVAAARSPLLLRIPLATAGVLLSYQGITGANAIGRLFDPRSFFIPRQPSAGSDRLRAESAVTVARPLETALAFWRDPSEVRRVLMAEERLNLALGEDRPADGGQAIVWLLSQAPPGSAQTAVSEPTAVSAPDASADRANLRLSLFIRAGQEIEGEPSTEIHASLGLPSPEGTLGRVANALLGHIPAAALDEALRRARSLLEAGDVLTTDGQPSGRLKPVAQLADRGHAGLPAGART